jgi:hypothetical protein
MRVEPSGQAFPPFQPDSRAPVLYQLSFSSHLSVRSHLHFLEVAAFSAHIIYQFPSSAVTLLQTAYATAKEFSNCNRQNSQLLIFFECSAAVLANNSF